MAYRELHGRMISGPKTMRQDSGLDVNAARTSGLEFMHTASHQVLHFLWRDLCPLPGISPFGFRGRSVDYGGGVGLFLHTRVFAPEDS